MSVYIRGMEMPEDGEKLYMITFSDGKACASYKPFEWHEVIPVPDHGDLIDRKETLHKLSNEKVKDIKPNMTWGEIDELIALDIVTMPTIIPAEEEKS